VKKCLTRCGGKAPLAVYFVLFMLIPLFCRYSGNEDHRRYRLYNMSLVRKNEYNRKSRAGLIDSARNRIAQNIDIPPK
jgi:hypothetical protein